MLNFKKSIPALVAVAIMTPIAVSAVNSNSTDTTATIQLAQEPELKRTENEKVLNELREPALPPTERRVVPDVQTQVEEYEEVITDIRRDVDNLQPSNRAEILERVTEFEEEVRTINRNDNTEQVRTRLSDLNIRANELRNIRMSMMK